MSYNNQIINLDTKIEEKARYYEYAERLPMTANSLSTFSFNLYYLKGYSVDYIGINAATWSGSPVIGLDIYDADNDSLVFHRDDIAGGNGNIFLRDLSGLSFISELDYPDSIKENLEYMVQNDQYTPTHYFNRDVNLRLTLSPSLSYGDGCVIVTQLTSRAFKTNVLNSLTVEPVS